MEERKLALDNLIFEARTGADAYGTVTEASDSDFVGIFIPTKDYILGTKRVDQVTLSTKNSSEERRNTKEDVDRVLYSLPKFIQLAKANNPNIIEFFFLPERCILSTSFPWDVLKGYYNYFVSKKAYHTFKGYAYSQRLKLQTKKENMTGRTELVEKFGWDVKFGSHLIRLLLEGLEILVEGKIQLPLTQNNLVRDIKIGRYSLEEVLKKADELEKLIDQAYVTSNLQNHCNEEAINRLQISLIESWWNHAISYRNM